MSFNLSDGDLLVDPEDEYLVSSRTWRKTPQGYAACGAHDLLHRLVAMAGPNDLVDHINGNRLDNRRENLRLCDRSQSNCNRRARSDSAAPYKGITRGKYGGWIAQITHRKKATWLGEFKTPEEAARVYDDAATRLHGEFAKTNESMNAYTKNNECRGGY